MQVSTASKLIPWYTNSGIRPIGVGEVIRRIIGSAVMDIASPELMDADNPFFIFAQALVLNVTLLCMQ